MQILIAEDDATSRCLLENALTTWGYNIIAVGNGESARKILQSTDAPQFAILDWNMPEMDGVEVCHELRAVPRDIRPYLILLTANTEKDQVVEGLRCGADDYITKPFNWAELQARVQQGWRILDLQTRLLQRVRELEESFMQVKHLQELLPICCYCKKVRDDRNYWHQVETYLSTHFETRLSHSVCPSCLEIAEREFEQDNIEALN